MRTKPGVDTLSFDDLYNNLRVFESDVKGSTASSSSPQNVAFVSENTSSTNDVSTAYCVPNPSGQNSQYEQTSSYSLLANQSSCPQLDHEDLEQIDEYDLEEMDLKWQVAMISMRMKKFYKKTGRKLQFDAKEPVGFDKTKVECYNCHKTGHFARECRIKGNQDNRRRDAWNSGTKDGSRTGQKEDSKALVTIDGEGVDWTNHSEDEDYALMACNSSDSDTEVISCSNKCKESYANLKKLYDAQREQLSDASIEIKAYSQGLKKVEAQLVAHQQGQLWYEQKIKFMKIDLDDKTDVLTYHKKLLAEAQKEKEDLKAKVEKWHNSSKNLSKLLNTQMSANDKFGLGYGDHRYDGILSYENEVLQSVFMNKESEIENQPLYDRFVTAEGMHVVPPPMIGNYMPSDLKLNTEPSELVSEPVVNESNVECQPKIIVDFHEKKMARKLTSNICWNNVQRLNKQNQFVPSAVLTRTGKIPVSNARASSTKNFSTARQSFNRQTVLTNTAMKVNTVKSIMNRVRPANIFHKTHSPSTRPFKKTTILRTKFSNQKINTAKVNAVSTVGGKRETAVKSSAGCNWRSQRYNWHKFSKYNSGSNLRHCYTFKRSIRQTQAQTGLVDVSMAQTGNKAYLAEFQDFKWCVPVLHFVEVVMLYQLVKRQSLQHQQQMIREVGPREEETVFMDNLEKTLRGNKHEAMRKSEFSMVEEQLVPVLAKLLWASFVDSKSNVRLWVQLHEHKDQRFPRKSFSMKHKVHKESVSKQGRKFAKGESSVQRDPLFDEIPEDTVDHMETENAQNERRTREMVDEDKEIDENILSTEDVLSTDKDGVSTIMEKVSTDRPIVITDGSKGTEENIEKVLEGATMKIQDEKPKVLTEPLWGDLMVMFNPDDENEFWNAQQDWNILESEEDSTMALELIRFIKKILAELEPEEKD
ncbi:ribonuclease H-like domain-containing protein [Tanacetum coccineum]